MRIHLPLVMCLLTAIVLSTACVAPPERETGARQRALMLVASSPTAADRGDEFEQWYDRHVEEVLAVEGIVSATRWVASPHKLLSSQDGVAGRRYLALYEIECDDVEAVRDRILATSDDRHHSELLEMEPLPLTVLFEFRGEWPR